MNKTVFVSNLDTAQPIVAILLHLKDDASEKWSLLMLQKQLQDSDNLYLETTAVQAFLDKLIEFDLVIMRNFRYQISPKKIVTVKIEISE